MSVARRVIVNKAKSVYRIASRHVPLASREVAAVETLLPKVRISYPNMPPRCKAPVKRATSRLAREVTVL